MEQSPFWKTVTKVLLPGVGINNERNKEISSAQSAQNQSIDEATKLQQANFDYIKQQNEPLIKIGDQYLDILRKGVESGAFDMDESMFKNYQQYVVPEYQQGGKFESLPRENIVSPQQFQYNQQRAAAPQYQNYNLDQSGQPKLQQTASFGQYFNETLPQNKQPGSIQAPGYAPGYMSDTAQQFSVGQNTPFGKYRPDAPGNQMFSYGQTAPQDMQWNQQRQDAGQFNAQQAQQYAIPEQFQYNQPRMQDQAYNYDRGQALQTPDAFNYAQQRPGYQQLNYNQRPDADQFNYGQQRPEYQQVNTGPWTNTSFDGQKYMENYDQYQGQQAPNERDISDQFNTQQYRQDGSRPDIYRAENAPDAQYYDPTKEQYQSKEFRLEDDPVYQRRLQQSGKAIEDSAARQGMQLSGANFKALQENAQALAAEEGDAAYNRYRQQDAVDYGRFMDRQNQVKDAMRFNSADEYQRYLDQTGIRKEEQAQLIGQWEQDRAFGADQNKEAFLREQATKQLGRELNDDEYQRWLSTDGQKFAQFADQRDWTTSQSNLNAARDWEQYTYEKGFGRDVFTDDRNNAQQQAQLRNQYNTDAFNTDRNFAYQANQDYINRQQGNYNTDRSFAYQQNQDLNNALQQGYTSDRDFAYRANQDNIDNRINAYNINNANRIDDRNFGYQQNQDAINRTDTRYLQDRDFAYNTNRDLVGDRLDAYNINNANRIDDRNFGYQQNQDMQNQYDTRYQQDFANQLAMNQYNQGNYQQNYQNAYQANTDYQNRAMDLYGMQNQNYNQDYQNYLANKGMNFDQNLAAYNVNNANRIDTRNFNADQFQQGYQNNLSAYDRNMAQYNANRDFAYGQQQDQFGNNLAQFNALQGQYQNSVANQMAANQMNFDNNMSLWNAQNQNYNADRQFASDQYQNNWNNQFDVWNAKNANITTDNAMNFDVWNQNNQNNWNQYQYKTNLGYQQNQDKYGMLTDSYNRQLANKQNQYTTIGDLMNVGMTARNNLGNAMGAYSDSLSDLSLQRGNAAAAASAARQANSGILKQLGL